MSSNRLLDTALYYAKEYGWAVFPVGANKKPLTPHGFKDAKKDPGAIKAWWKQHPTAGIGVATGSMSNLIVIDEDIDEAKGLNGYEEVSKWEAENGNLPETVTCITGRGGYHLYFHYEGKDIGNRAGILEGVDVRGEGGYVIAPPSPHPNGTEYVWELPPDEYDFAPLNDTVKRFLLYKEEVDVIADSFEMPDKIEEGTRNDTLYRLACSLQAKGLPDNAIIEAVMATNLEKCAEPLDRDEIELLCSSAFTYEKGKLQAVSNYPIEYRAPKLSMILDKDGEPTNKPAQTVKNAEEAIQYDKDLFGRIVFNELSRSIYVYGNLPWRVSKGYREWDNSDDNNLWAYIETKYGLKDVNKLMAAHSNVAHRVTINPVVEMLKSAHERWDGNTGHIASLLPKYTGAEASEYNTEVLKLFMLGAISRIHKPGCKFDYMLVLVGEQGKYKSSFLRFLATNDEWFNDNFSTLDGDRAFEKLQGMWIVELAELQATKRTKDVETIKAFITSRDDTYRAPYARRKEHHKRMCVLAGTSNPVDFLTDRTGNRRFLPITCGVSEPTNPFTDLEQTHADFQQAWGEAMDIYMRSGGKVSLALNKKYEKQALEAQQQYTEDDPDIGIIQEWLNTTDYERVCVSMLWSEALQMDMTKPTPKEINHIHDIMKNSITGWKYVGKQKIIGSYGIQRAYSRTAKVIDPDEKPPF
jgi:predicted P-loop ATPase